MSQCLTQDVSPTAATAQPAIPVRSVKEQFILDMEMAGLSASTRRLYLQNVLRFVRRTGLRPQDASEQQVATYLHGLVTAGLCQGTILPNTCALRFLFLNTLGREWELFKKRRSPRCADAGCPWFPARISAAA